MNINKGSVVKQSGNNFEGCRSQKILFQPNMRVFLQYGVNDYPADEVSQFIIYKLSLAAKSSQVKKSVKLNQSKRCLVSLRGALRQGSMGT